MAAHRYWRIYITATIGGSAVQLREVRMAESVGGADVIGSGTPTASSNSISREPSRAVDNGTASTSYWQASAATFPQWWKYDFGAGNDKDILEVLIAPESSNNARPSAFDIEWSDDNSVWTGVATFSGLTTGWSYTAGIVGIFRSFEIPLPAGALPRITQNPLLVIHLPNQDVRITQIPLLPIVSITPIPLPLPIVPDVPVKEIWQYLTSIFISENAKEQRMALRDEPRFLMQFSVVILNETDRCIIYEMLMKFINRKFDYPAYYYSAKLSAAATAGATKLFFDPEQTDVRDGEPIAIYNPSSDVTTLLETTTVEVDGIELASPLVYDVPIYCYVCPAPRYRTTPIVGFSMVSISGDFTLSLQGIQSRSVERPGAAPSLTTLDGMLILHNRPLALDQVDESFDQNMIWLDNGISEPTPRTNWKTPFISGGRSFLLKRPDDMDYWRAVANTLKGRQKAFLLPTFREDFPLYETPALSATEIKTTNVQFADIWPSKAWRYVRIESDAGTLFIKINDIVVSYDGDGLPLYLTVKLASSIGAGVGSNANMKISYVNTCRLDSDDISIMHYDIDSVLSIDVRMIEE